MRTMRKAGRIGEGEFLTQRGLYDSKVERYVCAMTFMKS
jgi:hypothetical protein